MKLQPNFSYQKYQDKPEEQWKQFELDEARERGLI